MDNPEIKQHPAFPVPVSHVRTGMMLRDYFAGQALVGLVPLTTEPGFDRNVIAEAAYKIADAMLSKRMK